MGLETLHPMWMEHYKTPPTFEVEVPFRTIPVKISDEEMEKVYGGAVLHEVVGERAEEVLRLVHEKLREEELEVSDEVERVIANFLVIIGKKVSEMDI